MPPVKTIKRDTPKISARLADIGGSGDGIVHAEGGARFLPFGVTGDLVAFSAPVPVKHLQAGNVTLLESGAERRPPPCPHHGDVGVRDPSRGCGGCRMQQVSDPAYRAWKQALVARALEAAGLDSSAMAELQVSPPNSRRRASLSAERLGKRTVVGFQERGSHRIVDMHACLILRPELFALVAPLRELPLLQDRERGDYMLTVLSGAVDLVIERKRELSLPEREGLAELAEIHDIARISWRAGPLGAIEAVAHRRPVYARFGPAIGGTLVNIPPGAFLQATAEGEAALQRAVLDALPAHCSTLDLFAGAGTFTFPASTRGPVHALDSNGDSVAALKFAARPGVTTEKRDLFTDPVTLPERYDAVIMDPPYAGAKAQAEALARSSVPLVISVSCNPVSFARDAALLVAGGYRLERVTPIDQFLWSAEIEVVGVFRR